MTRVLLFSDLHLGAGADLGHAPGDRLEDQVAVGCRIVEIARERDCSLILNGGDSFEGPLPTPEHYDAFRRAFADWPGSMIACRGNGRHDAAKRAVSAPEVVGLAALSMTVSTRAEVVPHHDVVIATLPWTPVDRLVAANGGGDRAEINRHAAALLIETARGLRAECVELYPDLPHILAGHWCVEGAAGWQFMAKQEPVLPVDDLQALGFDLCAFGHIHEHGILSALYGVEPPVISIGSPMPHHFGEETYEHGIWIYDTETRSVEFIPIESRPLVELSFDSEEVGNALLGDVGFVGAPLQGAIVKVKYQATAEQEKRIDRRKLTAALYAAGAHHVWKIEPTVERETRARVEGISKATTEREQLDVYMAARGIEGEEAEAMRKATDAYLSELRESGVLQARSQGGTFLPLRLWARNYRRFEAIDLTIPDGVWSLEGNVLGVTATNSNGAGKSTVAGLIDVATYGPEGDGTPGKATFASDYPLEGAAGDLEVGVEFEQAGKRYRIRRNYNGKGSATCDLEKFETWVDEAGVPMSEEWKPVTRESTDATGDAITELIGMSRTIFRTCVYLAQNARSFADPAVKKADRLDLMFEAFQLNFWLLLRDLVRRDKRDVEAGLQEIAGRVETFEAQLAGREDADRRSHEAAIAAGQADASVVEIEQRLDSLRSQIADAEKVESERSAAQARVQAAEAEWRRFEEADQAAEKAREGLAPVEAKIAELEPVVSDKFTNESAIARLTDEHSSVTLALRAAEAKVRERDQLLRDIEQRAAEIVTVSAQAGASERAAAAVVSGEIKTCHACGQEIADKAADKLRQTYLDEADQHHDRAAVLDKQNAFDRERVSGFGKPEEEVESLTARLAGVSDSLGQAREQARAIQAAEVELVSLKARASNFRMSIAKVEAPGYVADKAGASEALEAARAALPALDAAAPDLAELRRSAESASFSLDKARTDAQSARAEVVRAEEALARIAEAERQLAEQITERSSRQAQLARLSRYEQAYGRTGIPLCILEEVAIPTIEEEADRILAMTSGGYRIEIRTASETKKGDLKDACEVVVLSDEGVLPYRKHSGGECSRIAPALALGFGAAVKRVAGVDCPLLIIDELPYLDAAGSAAFVALLRSLVDSGEYESICSISHDPEIRDAFDRVVEIRRDGGRSEVVA